jgi:DNA-binding MarR family transcriptional regulator
MDSTQKFREVLTVVYQRFNVLQRGEKRCFGVSMSQCMTLELLQQEGPMNVRQLAERLGLDTSTVTRGIDVLVRDRMLQRTRDEEGDRRRVVVSLTSRGRTLAAKLQECGDAYCARILARIPTDQREDVIHCLRVLVDAIGDLPETCG